MAVPLYVGAGAGITLTTGTGTVNKTTCIAGNVIVCHMTYDGTNSAGLGRGSTVNIEKIDGTDSDMDVIVTGASIGNPQAQKGNYYIGRVMANGTVSMNFTVNTAGDDLFARMYEFSGVSTATTVAGVVENNALTYVNAAASSSPILDTDVVTLGSDRLALQFVNLNSNEALGAFTGMSGGTWAEAVAEYVGSGTVMTLQLQTASMPTAGTISGGTHTITPVDWGVMGTALIPAPGQTLLPDADTAEGGWTTAPLFSKINDSSDATIITATAS